MLGGAPAEPSKTGTVEIDNRKGDCDRLWNRFRQMLPLPCWVVKSGSMLCCADRIYAHMRVADGSRGPCGT